VNAARVYLVDLSREATHALTAAMTKEHRQAEIFLAGAPGILTGYPEDFLRVVGPAWAREAAAGVPWEVALAYADPATYALSLTDFEHAIRTDDRYALADTVYIAADITLSSFDGSPEDL
jgi:hypothetical protein